MKVSETESFALLPHVAAMSRVASFVAAAAMSRIASFLSAAAVPAISAVIIQALVAACAAPPVVAAPFSGLTGLKYQQEDHNKRSPDSKLHDGQQRPPASPQSEPTIHISRPAPDKTKQAEYRFVLPTTKQRNQNAAGPKRGGNQGYEKVFDREMPKHPATEAENPNFAMLFHWIGTEFTQIAQSPQAQLPSAVGNMQGQQQGTADATANAGLDALEDGMTVIIAGNINVANESTGTPGSTMAPFRPISQAIWMVQTMYKRVYLPMAILLLLPGALILHLKVILNTLLPGGGNDEDAGAGPLAAILRSMVAVFLIPATQLILSYSIDVGNSMTFEIERHIQMSELVQWARGQQEAREAGAKAAQKDPRLDPQPYSTQTLQMMSGVVNMSMGLGLVILAAFQLVMSCYLMLMGPIAAALYAWPGGVGKLFKPVFVNWVNAVITLSLWRFWWLLIVLVMITRIQWLREIGEYQPNTEWEALMLGCFLVMMSYVPFAPFELKPGELVDKLLEKAKEVSGSGARGGGGGKRSGGRPNPAPKTA